jgi:hypothetical protein
MVSKQLVLLTFWARQGPKVVAAHHVRNKGKREQDTACTRVSSESQSLVCCASAGPGGDGGLQQASLLAAAAQQVPVAWGCSGCLGG